MMLRDFLIGGGFILVGFVIIVLGLGRDVYSVYEEFKPHFTAKEHVVNLGNRGVVLLDRHGQPFFTLYQPRLITYIPLAEVPEHFQQAVLGVEDHRFYAHPGVSLRGIARAVWFDVRHRTFLHGGSTITQQLVKNSLLSREKSFTRKWKEVVLAVALERHFSKPDILEMYLNTAYFGQGMVGIENAAQHYFGKSASELTSEESYFLVALLPSPSSLLANEEHLLTRQRLVVNRLAELGLVSPEQRQAFRPRQVATRAEVATLSTTGIHFALMVKNELLEKYGEDTLARSGFTVKTTLDLAKQKEVEAVVAQSVGSLTRSQVHNGAAVVVDPKTGDVLSLVGSRDWNDERWGQVNMAATPRQTGSAFKPIVYATAFEERAITPATILQDKPTTFGVDYKPENYDRKFRGPVSVRRALANSLNVPAVEVMSQVGVGAVVAQAKAMGISSLPAPQDSHLALALGAGEISLLELTNAYGVFANQGTYLPARLILEIQDKLGKPLPAVTVQPQTVLSPGAAFLTTSILSDERTRQEVFGGALSFARPAAVKTGTTQNYRDAWTVGFTPSLAVGVWIGNNDNAPMNKIAGAMGAAPIWKKLMSEFTQGLPYENFSPPAEVQTVRACGRSEYFLSGMQQPRRCFFPRPSVLPIPENAPAPNPLDIKEEKPKFQPREFEEDDDGEWEIIASAE